MRSGSTTSSPFDGTSKWAYKPRVSPLFLAGSRFSIENLSGSTTLPRSSSSCPNLRLQRNSLPSPITVHREWPIASSLLFPFLPFLAMPGAPSLSFSHSHTHSPPIITRSLLCMATIDTIKLFALFSPMFYCTTNFFFCSCDSDASCSSSLTGS